MWHAVGGDRVLRGAEAQVFAESLLDLIELELTEEGDYRSGIPVFDSLTYPQKIAALHQAARALFYEAAPKPKPTAVLEGAVGAVFENMSRLLEEEIHGVIRGDMSLRRLVRRACRDLEVESAPCASSDNIDEWSFCMQCLHDAVLWDSDYLAENTLADLPPERSMDIKQRMGISDEYFRAVAPDPSPKQVAVLLAELNPLCHEMAEAGRPEAGSIT